MSSLPPVEVALPRSLGAKASCGDSACITRNKHLMIMSHTPSCAMGTHSNRSKPMVFVTLPHQQLKSKAIHIREQLDSQGRLDRPKGQGQPTRISAGAAYIEENLQFETDVE